jgi:hypothetical protein
VRLRVHHNVVDLAEERWLREQQRAVEKPVKFAMCEPPGVMFIGFQMMRAGSPPEAPRKRYGWLGGSSVRYRHARKLTPPSRSLSRGVNSLRGEGAGIAAYEAFFSCAACLPRPFLSSSNSKLTRSPSLSARMPAASTAVACTNTSLPPSSGVMKPKPFAELKNLTLPLILMGKAFRCA